MKAIPVVIENQHSQMEKKKKESRFMERNKGKKF